MASAGRIDRLDLRLVRIEESIESIETALFPASMRLDGNIRRGCSEGGRYAKDAGRLHPRWRRACDRQEVVLRHITEIERRLGVATTIAGQQDDKDGGDDKTERRLGAELERRGMESTSYAFMDVMINYYDKVLPVRASILEAQEQQLCKSIVLVNTQYDPNSAAPEDSLWDSPYVLVIVQYITKLNSEKVAKVMHKMGTKGLARRRLNFQLCDDSDGDITGYAHNAVVPVLLKTRMPIIISSAIAKLDAFWMGGGEVHKKLWVQTDAFLGAYRDEISVEDIAYI